MLPGTHSPVAHPRMLPATQGERLMRAIRFVALLLGVVCGLTHPFRSASGYLRHLAGYVLSHIW
jgi:hypothetical protein